MQFYKQGNSEKQKKSTQYPIVVFKIIAKRRLYLKEVYLTCLKDL